MDYFLWYQKEREKGGGGNIEKEMKRKKKNFCRPQNLEGNMKINDFP